MNKKIKFLYATLVIVVFGGGITFFIMHTASDFSNTVDVATDISII